MKWLAGLALFLLIALSCSAKVSAEVLCDTIDDICIPSNITWGAQIEWQGHAITHARQDPDGGYTVEVARDSEPHEYPYFNAKFTSDWQYVGTTVKTDPAAIKRAQDEANAKALQDAQAKAKAEQDRIKAEQDAQRQAEEERNKPKPQPEQPPVVKPDPPTPTEPPDEEPTNGGE